MLVWAFVLVVYSLPAKDARSDGDFLIDVWTAEKGLRNSSVTSVAQTPDGYLWVGTYNGLARFDGVRFVTFDPENTPELLHARIRKLYLDAQGTLWINTYDGSLTSLRDGAFKLEWRGTEYADAQIVRIASKPGHVTFLLPTGNLIRRDFTGTNTDWRVIEPPAKGLGTSACEDGAGTLWYRGRDSQLWRQQGDQFQLLPAGTGLDGQRVRYIAADSTDRIWVGTDRGLAVWGTNHFVDMTPTNGDANVDVTFVSIARDGGVWVVANGNLRKCIDRRWVEGLEVWEGMAGGQVMRLGVHEPSDGSEWFYQYGLGLAHVRPNGTIHRFNLDEGFLGDRVDCFCEDSEGNFWAGVNRGGLVRMRKKRFQVLSVYEGSQPAAMLSVCQDQAGALWFGSMGDGLVRWQDEQLAEFSLPGGSSKGLVFSAYPGGDGTSLWLSAGDEDLYVRTEGQVDRCVPFVHGVKSLLASRDGRAVWAGTKTGLFVCTNLSARNFSPYPGVPRTVTVRSLAEGAGGVLWAGTEEGDLYRITAQGVEVNRPDTVGARHPIWSLLADDDGTVWAGTFRGGLLRFRAGRFNRFTATDGLPDNVIAQLLSDGAGNLWVGSHQGIFRVARSSLAAFANGQVTSIPCTAYGRFDGLPAEECSGSYQPACWRAADGRLWFAMLNGVVSIHPGDVAPNLRPPPVVIEEVLVDGVNQDLKTAPMHPELVPLGPGGNRQQLPVINVPPGKRQFEFRFTGLSFVSPDKVRFRYRLEHLEKDWVEAGTRRSAQYSWLRPGDYQFQVTACNNEGIWNTVGSGLILHVRPHFYETNAFILLLACSGLGAVILAVRQVYKRRLRTELERVERQRAVERDRARIARDIHDDLGAGLTQITLLSELARQDPPDEVDVHVSQISITARELTRAMDEIVWAINPQNDTLDGLITYVSKFAQQYLAVAGIRCRLDVPTELPVCVLGAEIRHNLYLVIKEALNNIVKHSQATVVSLRLEYTAGCIKLSIQDNGRGIAPLGHPIPDAGDRASSGHGLGNMTRRLADIGGRCEVVSQPGQGTEVLFTINIPEAGSPRLATGSRDGSEPA